MRTTSLQEAWLRLSRTEAIDDLPAWLTTVVTRLCLDQLRKRRTRSVVEAEVPADPAPVDPEADALLAEKTGDAMQVVLDALAPAETGGIRPARCVRLSVRRDQRRHGALGYRRTPAGEPGAAQGAGHAGAGRVAGGARREPAGRRRVPHCSPRWGARRPCCRCSRPTPSCVPIWSDSRWARNPSTTGAAAVAARFNGARGATPVTIDGELGAAWIQAGSTKVAFVFHVTRRAWCSEVELIADPDVLATMDIVRVRAKSRG